MGKTRIILGLLGKGGTGKTTLSGLLLKALINLKKEEEFVLLIDADPNECLPAVLDISDYSRLGDMISDYYGQTINPVEFKDRFQTHLMENEQDEFSMLIMGRGHKLGCYCLVNYLLRESIKGNVLSGDYAFDYILMDCEAGLEHISRETSTWISDLIVVCDGSKMARETIKNVREVVKEVRKETSVGNLYVLGNRITHQKSIDQLEQETKAQGMTYLGTIPMDPIIEEANIDGQSLLTITEESPAYQTVLTIIKRILAEKTSLQNTNSVKS
ncbi:MAG: nucleotide-binding protein [Candidatus Hodarchaeales archaeon]|jgi:CO dehydrogenase maturation factor